MREGYQHTIYMSQEDVANGYADSIDSTIIRITVAGNTNGTIMDSGAVGSAPTLLGSGASVLLWTGEHRFGDAPFVANQGNGSFADYPYIKMKVGHTTSGYQTVLNATGTTMSVSGSNATATFRLQIWAMGIQRTADAIETSATATMLVAGGLISVTDTTINAESEYCRIYEIWGGNTP